MKRLDGGAWWPLLVPLLGLYLPACSWLMSAWGDNKADSETGWQSQLAPMLFDTLWVAFCGALVAGFLGGLQAVLLEAFPVRGRRWLRVVLLLPFLLPAAALTTAFHLLLAGGHASFLVEGVTGASFLSGIQMAPIVLWGTARAIAAIPGPEWNAIQSQLSPGRAALFVIVPRIRGTVLRLTLLSFALLFPQLEIPGYTGTTTLGFRVQSAFTSGSDVEGWILVLLSAVVVVPVILVAAPALTRFQHVPLLPAARAVPGSDRSVATDALWLIAVLYLIPIANLLQLATSVSASVQLEHALGFALEVPRALLLAALVSLAGWRLAQVRSGTLWMLFALPLLLPGSLPGLALTSGLPASWLRAIGDWPLALSVAQAARFAGIGLILGRFGVGSIPRAELDSARMLPPRVRRWRILLPRSVSALCISVLFVSVLVLGEVESANLLAPPGYTIPVLDLHNFLHFRYDESAAALALMLSIIGTALALMVVKITSPRR